MKSLCSKSKQPAMDILINCLFFVFNYQTDTLTKTPTTEHPKKIQIAVLNAIFMKIKVINATAVKGVVTPQRISQW